VATDPGVTRKKFDREIAQFRAQEQHYREQGIWMLDRVYPQVLMAFATARAPQVFVPFGALIDFEDYDAKPLKVTLVNPCSRQALRLHEILPQLMQLPQGQVGGRLMRVRHDPSQPTGVAVDNILQGYDFDPSSPPFLCIAGVRAYHDHPAHSGDSWWLHRGTGHGTLHQVIHMLWAYGTKNITQPLYQSQVAQVGFMMQPDVEAPLAP
jgi:hypothetical protein